ncbi:MAG: hypothetical protein MPJ24_08210 [Pirellulaceae bacterium]|nr:hypothetical protein [Pirellulaceae bacterium]
MSQHPQSSPSCVPAEVTSPARAGETPKISETSPSIDRLQIQLLQKLVEGQQRQNELIEDLSHQVRASQQQRTAELLQWKQAHPHLARKCREATETLGAIQTEFLTQLTDEVSNNGQTMLDSEYMLGEFVDRFGPRLVHLSGVMQLLAQLGGYPTAASEA